jgi:hypothetical protein
MKKLGRLLDKAGIRYKINNDGSLSIYNVDFALAESYYDHKIGDVYVEGHLYHTIVPEN